MSVNFEPVCMDGLEIYYIEGLNLEYYIEIYHKIESDIHSKFKTDKSPGGLNAHLN